MRIGERNNILRNGRREAPGRAGRRRAGFTLAEIMIAMGVLAVGMSMIAAALHAGISVHIRTIDDIMRQLIADNSLALVQARMRHSSSNGITTTYKMLGTKYFGSGDLRFPTQKNDSLYGAAVLMKRRAINATAGSYANDYDVLVVPYTLIPQAGNTGSGSVSFSSLNCNVSGKNITSAPSGKLKVGMVIIDEDGHIAVVTSIPNNTSATVDTSLTASSKVMYIQPSSGFDIESSAPVRVSTALSPEPGWGP